jgi:hypothetical protein
VVSAVTVAAVVVVCYLISLVNFFLFGFTCEFLYHSSIGSFPPLHSFVGH